MMMKEPEPLTLTIPEAAKRLGIGRNSAYRAAANGELPTIRLGKRILVPRIALEKKLESAA
jgi:excisionase family DNA binding protein